MSAKVRENCINIFRMKLYVCFFFFFKQKTAYEIYQCDWSSDVCSSDLRKCHKQLVKQQVRKQEGEKKVFSKKT